MFMRILVAVVTVVLLFMLIPLLIQLSGLSFPLALVSVVKICIIGVAFYYIVKGTWP